MIYRVVLFCSLFSKITPYHMVKIISILPDIPIAPGIRTVGAALELAVDKSNILFQDHMNISLVKSSYTGSTCADYEQYTIDFAAREIFYWPGDSSCIAVIGTGFAISSSVRLRSYKLLLFRMRRSNTLPRKT